MADPRRLLDDPDLSELGRATLESAASDGPDGERRRAVARRLGIAVGLTTLAAGEASAVAWWKVVVVALAVGGGGVAVVKSLSGEPSQTVVAVPAESRLQTSDFRLQTPEAERTQTEQPVVIPPPVVPAPAAVTTAHHAVTRVPPPAPKAPQSEVRSLKSEVPAPQAPVVDDPPPAAAAPPAAAPLDARRLAAEVALLDKARAALASDPAAALEALDEHARSFPDGALLAEADLVRIEALLATGRRSDATALANSFLSRYPRSPLAKRVRSLLAR
jgi:hypothetical protein